jgi:polyisoprenoid-binding protein YceI
MALRHSALAALIGALAMGFTIVTASAPRSYEADDVALALGSGRVSIAGTSNIHEYTASTTAVRITRVQVAAGTGGPTFWSDIVKPGAVEALEVAIPAASLSSPKEGLDKNMHKALNVAEHADITFRLRRLEPRAGTPGALRGVGILQIAGVEREVAIELTTERNGAGLSVHGSLDILMTDFGIAPPKAMLGMLKTDPKVTITFDTLLTVPST